MTETPVTLTIDDDLFKDTVKKFHLYNGADTYYKDSDLSSLVGTGRTAIGACPAGIERSNEFNSKVPGAGIVVPRITSKGKSDPDFELNKNPGKGISLFQMLGLLSEDAFFDADGLHLKYFDKPVDRLVLITQLENFTVLNKIGKMLRHLQKSDQKLPIEVDVVVEYSVGSFRKETQSFVEKHKTVS